MFERILVPIDGSATSREGVKEAISVARLTGGRIKLLHVWEPPFLALGSEAALMRGEDIHDASREAGRRVLDDAAANVRAAGIEVDEQLQEHDGKRLCEQVAPRRTFGAHR